MMKNIILYFVQIRHTDDLPSPGTRLVLIMLLNTAGTNLPYMITYLESYIQNNYKRAVLIVQRNDTKF